MDKEKAKEIALKVGEHAEFCKCNETIPMLGKACKFCREEQIRDFNYIDNAIEMDRLFPYGRS